MSKIIGMSKRIRKKHQKCIDEIFKIKKKEAQSFCLAYIKETGLLPHQIIMCHQIIGDTFKLWYEPKPEAEAI